MPARSRDPEPDPSRAPVGRVATRRLIDAAATLDAANRALVNIWVNHGLDDVALARMTGLTVAVIRGRRQRIIEHLSGELALAPDEIRQALSAISAPAALRAGEPADQIGHTPGPAA